MTPFRKLLRGILERIAGVFYEGPRPPERLGEMVVAFANMRPTATREEWCRFVKFHVEECYRSGFTRGAEWAERDFWSRMPSVRPEEVADTETPEWRWNPGIILGGDRLAVVKGAKDG
jgi:hypothetical protein